VNKRLSREEEELRRKRVHRTAEFLAAQEASRSLSSDSRSPAPPSAILSRIAERDEEVRRAFVSNNYDLLAMHRGIGNEAMRSVLDGNDKASRHDERPGAGLISALLHSEGLARDDGAWADDGWAGEPIGAEQGAGSASAAPLGGDGRVTVRDPNAGLDVTYDLVGGGAPDVNLGQVKEQMGSGHPLDENTRRYMEWRFGVDFGKVRLHTGPKADALSKALFAHAFALGADVAFQGESYRPGTKEGDRLLAHELTHVVQAGMAPRVAVDEAPQQEATGAAPKSALPGARSFVPLPTSITSITRIGESLRGIAKSGSVSEPTDAIEVEADRMADEVVSVSRGEFQAAMRELAHGNSEQDESSEPGQAQAAELVKRALASRGEALPKALRERLEQALSVDLSSVRVYSDELAVEAAQAISARAFTVGTDIVFDSGEYLPDTPAGDALITHEITHVIEHLGSQSAAAPGATQRKEDESKKGRRAARRSEREIHKAAKRGVAGGGGKLPHLDRIQEAFGSHDVSDVKATVGGSAKEASEAIGAEAYASGDKVAFKDSPDLHTAAHEAAHVVQQRSGVSVEGGVGKAGDRYEQHADAVADAVVAGRSAAPLLDSFAGGTPGVQQKAVQRSASGAATDFLGQGYFAQATGMPALGGAVNDAMSSEEAEAHAQLPAVREELGPETQPESPEGAIETPATAKAAGDGIEGAEPGDPEMEETVEAEAPPKAPTPNLKAGEEGDTSAMEADYANAVGAIPTEIDDMETSPGPPPDVDLKGSSDPPRADRQETEQLSEAARLQGEAGAAIDSAPGGEQVQPLAISQEHHVEAPELPEVEGMESIAKMDEVMAYGLPDDVKAKTDELGQAQLETHMKKATSELEKAQSQRTTERDSLLSEAETENQKLIDDANAEQEKAVAEARAGIEGEQKATKDKQQAAVADMKGKSDREKAKVHADIDTRVAQDEAAVDAEFKKAEDQAETRKDAAETSAEQKKAQAQAESENDSWWDAAVSAISSAFDALSSAIGSILDGLVSAVTAVIDAAKDFATGLIDACCSFVCAALEAYGDFLKFLVEGLLGDIFPGLAAALTEFIDAAVNLAKQAVNYIAEKLKEVANALLDWMLAGITAILEAYKAAIQFALSLAKAVLTGDWEEMGRLILEGVLKLAGIPPEEFYAMIGKAMETIDEIIEDPAGFAGNVIAGGALGFKQFGANFLEHLKTGFFEWLVGPLGEMGLTLPNNWDLAGVFSLVAQVLGLTQEGIKGVVVDELGETAGVVFDYVWKYTEALITGGLEGLWDAVKEDVDSLWEMVIDGIKDWIMETIVKKAVLRLATMFNPAGAILNLIMTVWNFVQFLADNISKIWGVVSSVVDFMADLAAGVLKPAADGVENALASLIPIAIDLLAKLIGLGGITEKVKEKIDGVQEMVHGAIRKLIQKVKGMFEGGEEEGEEVEFKEQSFEAPTGNENQQESHKVFVEESGAGATVMVASAKAMPPDKQVKSGGEFEEMDGAQEAEVIALAAEAQRLATEAKEAGDQKKADQANQKFAELKGLLAKFAGIRKLEIGCPAEGGSALVKWEQLQEAKTEGGKVKAAVGTFIQSADETWAKPENAEVKPLKIMQDELQANEGAYILKGDEIKASNFEEGLGRLLSAKTIHDRLIPDHKQKFKTPEHMLFAHENNLEGFDMCGSMKGKTRGPVAEAWWFPSGKVKSNTVVQLRKELKIDGSYDKGLVRLTFSPEDAGIAQLKLHKPTALDGMIQGDEADPMWKSAPADQPWGITAGGKPEGVSPPVEVSLASEKKYIKGSYESPGTAFEPIEERATMTSGVEKVSVVDEGGGAAGLRIAGAIAEDALSEVLAGPLRVAKSDTGRNLANGVADQVTGVSAQVEEAEINQGLIDEAEYDRIRDEASIAAIHIEELGEEMWVPNLDRAKTTSPFRPAHPVEFGIRKTASQTYDDCFVAELNTQLAEQQSGLNKLTLDEWAFNRTLFAMDEDTFLKLDEGARKAVCVELEQRANELVPRARKYKKQLEDARDEVQAAMASGAPPDRAMIDRLKGRYGNERWWRNFHEVGLRELFERLTEAGGRWETIAANFSAVAVTHSGDQVAGGHGNIPDVNRVNKPKEGEPIEAWEAYLKELEAYFGAGSVNSAIGRAWTNEIEGVYSELSDKYPVAAHPILTLNLQLSYKRKN